MPEKIHRLAKKLQAEGKSEDSSWAIATAALKEVGSSNDADQDWPPAKYDHLDLVMPPTPVAYVPATKMPNDELKTVDGQPFKTGQPYTYPKITEGIHGACGQCKSFVEGGSCAIVEGTIDAIKGTCKFWQGGTPIDSGTPVFPLYNKVESEYVEYPYEPYLAEIEPSCGCAEPVMEAFVEGDHPRGEDGKFISTGEIINSGEDIALKLGELDWSLDYDDVEIPQMGGFDTKMSFVNAMINGSENEGFYKRDNPKKMWQDIIKNNPDHKISLVLERIEEDVSKFNKTFKKAVKAAKTFYRGTTLRELGSYADSGIVGGHKKSRYGYKFVSTSIDQTRASMFGGGVMVEYHGDKIRKNSTTVEYTPWAQPETKKEKIEQDTARYSSDVEVRLDKGTKIKGLIKKIWIETGLSLPEDFKLTEEDRVKFEKLAPIGYRKWNER